MNKKVLRTMLALCVVFIGALYVLKIFFPRQFIINIELKPLITIGNYIDTHTWAEYSFGILTSFITYWLYLCAVCRRWYLNLIQSLIVLLTIGISIGSTFIDLNVYTAISCSSFVLLPMLFKANLKEVGVVYTTHLFSQGCSLTIRNLPIYMTSINTLLITIAGIENYLWLVLFYLYYNYKEDTPWAGNSHHCTEKTLTESNVKLPESTERLSLFKKIGQSMSLNLRKIKLVIKDFIVDELWIYLIVLGSIALCSWIFNRWIEGLMFCIAHICVRRAFDKQFHFYTTSYCLSLTLTIVWFAIPIILPLSSSLLSSIIIAFLICFFGFIAQDRVDAIKEIKELNKHIDELLTQINHKDIYAMTEDELYEHCRSCGLDDVDCKIARLIVIERLKGQELYEAIGYSERQTKRKRKKILETIK